MTKSSNNEVICRNRKAKHEHHILETLECGIMLMGSEIKSIRNYKVSLDGSYAMLSDGEIWLIDANIEPYENVKHIQHEPKRRRKLLVKKQEIRSFCQKAEQKGNTLIPLKLYLKNGICKVQLAVCKGKQLHDKRQVEKEKQLSREIQESL